MINYTKHLAATAVSASLNEMCIMFRESAVLGRQPSAQGNL